MFLGTIYPNASFDEGLAAERLEKAMRGGKDEKEQGALLLLSANNAQRQMIRTPYKVRYGKDLEEELKKSLKGDFEELIISLMNTPSKEDAIQIHKAVKGLGTNEKLLSEILASRDNEEIEAIRNTYHSIYNKKLEDAVAGDTSGDYKKFLVILLQAARNTSTFPDAFKAQQDAALLAKPLEKKLIGGSGDKVEKYRCLATESFVQLRRIFQEYEKKAGSTLDKLIEKETSGDLRDLLLTLYHVAQNKQKYFAQLIHDAVKGRGTRDEDLIRVLVSRSEVDLEAVKEEFKILTGKVLQDTINEECKGKYREAMRALVIGNKKLTY